MDWWASTHLGQLLQGAVWEGLEVGLAGRQVRQHHKHLRQARGDAGKAQRTPPTLCRQATWVVCMAHARPRGLVRGRCRLTWVSWPQATAHAEVP